MEDKVYNWLVKKGNILIQKNGDCIALKLNYENGDCCLLTSSDTHEIIELLTNISKQIWEDPDYERKPYTNQLHKKTENEYCWEIEDSQLLLKYNDTEDVIEIKCKGNNSLNLEINYAVEIIQILEHLSK
ncbi:hypothetical protein ABH942_001579 [Flavobacterium sp. 28YEA47A]|uniref:hypothetical protein n=1 Tax=Flavobacterium sp. 28YEA47A TaxID=3156276 RepID=UPI003517A399